MIVLYRDNDAISVVIEDQPGTQFPNILQAYQEDQSNDLISVVDLSKNIDIFTNIAYTEFVDQNTNPYGVDANSTVNELNSNVFRASGTGTGNIPSITSPLTISLVEGQTLNYELEADYGVGYEWDLTAVPGVVTVDGNIRKIIGGSGLSVGSYNIPVKAINYNGEDSETIVLTVATPPFANTKSVKFDNQDWAGANAALLDSALGRSGNGSGSSDAWTIAFYYKTSTASQGQVILYFGNNDIANQGYIQLMQINSNSGKLTRLRYGSNNNNVRMQTAAGSLVQSTWQHIMFTYDGGTTGAASGSINDYYSRFKIYIDGVLQTTSNSNDNYGYTGSVVGQNFRLGRFVSGNYMRGANVDELAIWDSDQSANVSDIYNGGTPFDLTTLSTSPSHWWRMGDGDTYPTLQDNVGTAHFIMYNMTQANIVSDVPS